MKQKETKTTQILIRVTPKEKEALEKKYGSTAVMRYVLLTSKRPNLVN